MCIDMLCACMLSGICMYMNYLHTHAVCMHAFECLHACIHVYAMPHVHYELVQGVRSKIIV